MSTHLARVANCLARAGEPIRREALQTSLEPNQTSPRATPRGHHPPNKLRLGSSVETGTTSHRLAHTASGAKPAANDSAAGAVSRIQSWECWYPSDLGTFGGPSSFLDEPAVPITPSGAALGQADTTARHRLAPFLLLLRSLYPACFCLAARSTARPGCPAW